MPLLPMCPVTALPAPGEMKVFTVAGKEICIAHEDGSFAAIDNTCPHQGGPLAEGTLENGTVVCPWHAWAFSLKTGELMEGGDQGVTVYPLEQRGGQALIQIGE